MRKEVFILVMVLAIMLTACKVPKPVGSDDPIVLPSPPAPLPPPIIPPANPDVDSRCLTACDDANACTREACNQQTAFECKHIPLSPCCGNSVCESSEDETACPADCETQSPELKAIISKSRAIKSLDYKYEIYGEKNTLTDTYNVKFIGPYTLVRYDRLQHKGTFSFNSVLINGSSNTTLLFCDRECGIHWTAQRHQGILYAQKNPTEKLLTMRSAKIVGTENVQNKASTVIEFPNGDTTITRLKVWTFYGSPFSEEIVDKNGIVLSGVRYKDLEVDSLNVIEDLPSFPSDTVYSP